MAGNAEFYAVLESQIDNYYPDTCPGFDMAAALAERLRVKRLLDVGCGRGIFLDRVKALGIETSGLELNARAAETARGKGHRILDGLMAEALAVGGGGRFEMVTAFEVLEHVADPLGFLREAAAMVCPGGTVFVSVPNAEGVHRLVDINPHQWPPHHVSWWRRRDLRRIGELAGLQTVKVRADAMLGRQLVDYLDLRARIRRSWGMKEQPVTQWVGRLVSMIYRKLGMKYYSPRFGNSLHAEYLKTT